MPDKTLEPSELAKQFSILATDKDLDAVDVYLRGLGDVLLLSDSPTDDDKSLRPLDRLAIPISEAGKVSLFCYLAPRFGPSKVVIQRVSAVKVTVDEQHSHVVQFWRPFYDGSLMRRGRLYYHNTHSVGNGIVVAKAPEFCSWADKVMQGVRRLLAFDTKRRIYFGPEASRLLVSGTLRLR